MNRDKNRYAIRLSFLLILTFMAMIFSASFLKAEASCPLSGESRESSEARSSREQSEKPAQSLECFSTGEMICPPERTFSFALAFKSAEEALRAFRTKEEEPGPASETARLNASRSSISQAFRAGETPVYKMIVKYYSNDTVHPAGRQLNHATDTDSSFWAYIESDNAEVPTDGWKWSSSNPSILRIAETNEDSSICDFETPGAVGKVTITAKRETAKVRYSLNVRATETRAAWTSFRTSLLSRLLSGSESSQETCLLIARWLCDYSSYEVTDDSDWFSLLETHYGQCSHYAHTFAFLMEETGIPVNYVSDKDHAWNQVQIDGEWYNLDVTGMDDYETDGLYAYECFLVSDEVFWRSGPRTGSKSCSSRRYDFSESSPEESPWASEEWRQY